MHDPLDIRLLGPFEVLAGGALADVGGSKRQALLAMLALRNGRVVGVDALVDGLWGEELPAAPRNALHHHVARLRAALGEGSIVGSPDGYALKDARVDALRFEELLAETRAALRHGDVRVRGGHGRVGAGPLARPGAAGPAPDGVVQRRGTPARGAARRRARGALRGHARARRASGARAGPPVGARGQPLPGAAVGAADAGALSQRPAGRRAGDVPGGAARARRRAGTRAGTRAPPAPGGDPRARSRDRRRPGRAQAPRQPPRNLDLVRRPGGGARPGLRARARAPSRHAHRAAGRREEPARARDGAFARARVPGWHLARRLRAGGQRRATPSGFWQARSTFAAPIRTSAWSRGFGTPARSSFSTRASTCATRRRGSCRRSSPTVARSGSWRRAARRFTSRARCGSPSRPSAPLPWSSSSSVRGRRGTDSSRTTRLSRWRRRSSGGWTGCRSRSSLPPRA